MTEINPLASARFGSKAAFPALKSDFRSSPDSGLKSDIAPCPKGAKPGSRICNSPVRRLTKKAARKRLLNSNLMILNHAATMLVVDFRLYPALGCCAEQWKAPHFSPRGRQFEISCKTSASIGRAKRPSGVAPMVSLDAGSTTFMWFVRAA